MVDIIYLTSVILALEARIHRRLKRWILGSSPGMTPRVGNGC